MKKSSNVPAKAPKHKKIYSDLRTELQAGAYSHGDRLPSESELVDQFGVSRPTVARALAQLEVDGLVKRRVGSGTYATLPTAAERNTFGLLIPDLGNTEIFEQIARGISISRPESPHDLLWGSTLSSGAAKPEQAEQLCEYFIEKRVSGIFFAPLELTVEQEAVNRQIVRRIEAAHIPMVLLDRDIEAYPKRSKFDLVGIDNRRAGFSVTQHVLQRGAKSLLFFGLPLSAHTVEARARGFEDAIRQSSGDPAVRSQVVTGSPEDLDSVRSLLRTQSVDAIICANDHIAARLLTSLTRLGVAVPGDVLLTGMDDTKWAELLHPPLTSIHQPCLELGTTALTAMHERITHPTMSARDYHVDFTLNVRRSTMRSD